MAIDIRSLFSMSSGSKYFEIRLLDGLSGVQEGTVGIRTTLPSAGSLGYVSGLCFDSRDTNVYNDGSLVTTTGLSQSSNPIIGFALKFGVSAVEVWIAKNNVWVNSGNPSAGTGSVISLPLGTYYAAAGTYVFIGAFSGRNNQLLGIEDSQFYNPPTGFIAAATDTIVWEPVP